MGAPESPWRRTCIAARCQNSLALLIDLPRFGVYAADLRQHAAALDLGVLAVAVASAFAGAYFGNRHLPG